MLDRIRSFLFFEAFAFALASGVHSGKVIAGYEHEQARIAEGVIAFVLSAGLLLTLVRPDRARTIGIAVQAFALLGTLIGVVMMGIGVGPRRGLDVGFHFGILLVLVWGLSWMLRGKRRWLAV